MDFLNELGIKAVNQSASWGEGYTDTQDAGVIESIKP